MATIAEAEQSRRYVTPGVLTVDEVATELHTSGRTVRRWIQDGSLPAVVLPSGQLRVPIEAIRRLYHPSQED